MSSQNLDQLKRQVRRDTLRHFLCAIHADWCLPTASEDDGEKLCHWFHWPPNTFLLTSRLLEDTGIYRLPVVKTGAKAWPPSNWAGTAKDRATEWYDWLCDEKKSAPEWITLCIATLRDCLDVPMSDLFDWQGTPDQHGRIQKATTKVLDLCQTLVELHGVADRACVGFGLPSGQEHGDNPRLAMVTYLANSLLISTGSLATLSRFHGIVLPKMRTPQVGMTLRSLSMHLTYHRTDVEVMWRSLPWVNQDENTINLLIVPFPYVIRPDAFAAFPHPNFAESLGKVRYFKYSPPSLDNAEGTSIFDAQSILDYIEQAEKLVRKVTLLVFPEVALSRQQLHELQALLADRGDPQAPLIIAGVAGELPSDGKSEGAHQLGTNEVVLSTFFAGKWYDISQSKHHRWRLEGRQVEQYQIAGALAGTQIWWEAIDLPKRQVCCLAPNQWLVLCPLICEDLARQEPVYDVIRGVGPTLLTAILLDGPQLKDRWSARYASVLADDPGTSVLTATSLGMAKRSVPPKSDKPPDEAASCKVALWRDQKNGYREIEVAKDDAAVVMSISAEFLTEYTADGRDDGGSASAFVIHNHHAIRGGARSNSRVARDENRTPRPNPGDALDMIELSIFTHLVDSAIDHHQDVVDDMCSIAVNNRIDSQIVPRLREVIDLTREGRIKADKKGERSNAREDMHYSVESFQSILQTINKAGHEKSADGALPSSRWPLLIVEATRMLAMAGKAAPSTINLQEHEAFRVHQMVGRSILWAVHMRLDLRRRRGTLTHEESRYLVEIERLLADQSLAKARNEKA